MGFLKAILVIAITMALSIAVITMNGIHQLEDHQQQQQESIHHDGEHTIALPSKRVSRFLAAEYPPPQDKNPRAADHCRWDNDVCSLAGGYEDVYHKNTTKCCNNKCMDLGYDKHNCGACKKKCKYTETCCRGECVNTEYDKRHCGYCNNRCEKGQYCVFGLCGYA
ncbi:hypothetical protein PIB30_048185 [Stylosanthes scabra]|uniref:Stigma-specific Stig1 family protein n=1 Tax=Stylosanthes scabra TaxID=79078 RepID=A0ABU6ZFP5_9FABA|nr:hypothetical protein [Stylosanthes scabra]